MTFSKLYDHSKCPHCGNNTISYWEKMNLIDYRYTHECKECGGTLQLPLWHSVLYLGEVIMFIYGGVNVDMSSWQIIFSGVILLLFINFVQLLFIPIKG